MVTDKEMSFDVIEDIGKESGINDNLISIIIKLVRFLRENEFNIPLTASIMFLDMIKDFDFLSKKEFLYISKSIFCKTQMEYESYNDLFNKFFFEEEIETIKWLAEQEQRDIESKFAESKAKMDADMEKIKNEQISKSKMAIEEVLSARYKVYKEQEEFVTTNNMPFEDIVEKYVENTEKENDSMKLTKEFIGLKREIIKELVKDKEKIDFDSIKNNLEKLMMKNFTEDNNMDFNNLLLKTAETVSKVESEYNKKLNKINRETSELTAKKQSELNDLLLQKNKAIEKVKVKLSSKNHRREFEGKGAVIELLKNTDRTVTALNKEEYNSLIYYIKANASKFRTKIGSSMKKAKNKHFDYKKTLEQSVKFNGIPLKLYYKKPVVKKFKLFVVLDVSGSVSKYLKVLSAFLFELNTVFNGGIEVYGFVSDLLDFTEEFKRNSLDEAVQCTLGHRGYSNYYKALTDFYSECYQRIDKDSIILYFGDARNNKNQSGEELLYNINKKAKYSVWLNPGPKSKWNTGDSVMNVYSKNVNATYEVNKVNQLIYFLNNFAINNTNALI